MPREAAPLIILIFLLIPLSGCTGASQATQPKTIAHFTGQNQISTNQFLLDSGSAHFAMHHGSRADGVEDAFIVKLMDPDGDLVERVLITTGPYDGIITAKITNHGYYFLDVTAAAPWEITVSQ